MRRFIIPLFLTFFLTGGLCAAFAEDVGNADEKHKYVKAKKELVNIYEKLDPQSSIIRQTRRGEYFELLAPGESWNKIRVDDRDGFIEARHSQIVGKKTGHGFVYVMLVIVIIACIAIIILYVKKSQAMITGRATSRDDNDDDDDFDDD